MRREEALLKLVEHIANKLKNHPILKIQLANIRQLPQLKN